MILGGDTTVHVSDSWRRHNGACVGLFSYCRICVLQAAVKEELVHSGEELQDSDFNNQVCSSVSSS